MSAGTSPIARAIAELEVERLNLTARLAKVDAAIGTLRELFHLPANRATPASAHGAKAGAESSRLAPAIRAALASGPLAPGKLATKVGADRRTLQDALTHLEAEGTIVATGKTAGRRIALAGPRPAKEAVR